jgi:NAD-dependent DNA ligase
MNKIAEKILKLSIKELQFYCNSVNIKELHSLKLYFDDLYYNSNVQEKPEDLNLSNQKYDIIKSTLTLLDKEYKPPVGAKIRTNENRTILPFFMGSINKITPDENNKLKLWNTKNPSKENIISEKLDGVSGLFVYKKNHECPEERTNKDKEQLGSQYSGGEYKKMYTRGDGTIGADISFLIPYISSIPKNLTENITVRGELIIKKSVFTEKYKHRINARNMAAGLINAKTIKEGILDIMFIVYEIIDDSVRPNPSEQMKTLRSLGFITANYQIYKTIKNERIEYPGETKSESESESEMDFLAKIHNLMKAKSDYEIDGIIIQSNLEYDRNTTDNPDYLYAFKMMDENNIAETIVLDIEWSLSKYGQLIPVVIVEPVHLSGATISRISGNNASLLLKNKITPNSIVNVTRSKDVIPYIVNVVLTGDKFKYPNVPYTWGENHVHLMATNINEQQLGEMRIKLFASFFDKMNIKFVSEATIKKLYKHGFTTLLSILGAEVENLSKIPGLGKKSAERIVTNIKEGLKNVDVALLLGSSSIFGIGIGRKKIVSLLSSIPDLLSFSLPNKKELKNRILKVEGFSEITAIKIIKNLNNAILFVDSIGEFTTFKTNTRISDSLVGQKFCFTGFRDLSIEKNISDRGGKTITSISKTTTGLIINDGKKSSKSDKANKLGVKIYKKDEFILKFIT